MAKQTSCQINQTIPSSVSHII